ncbi:MAG: SusC/RagA family TonB-linked outer membrane protein [Prolixibacteraceae bacterium]
MKKRRKVCCRFGSIGNLLLKMKLLTFLIFVSIVSVTASSYSQQVKFSMDFENAPVQHVLQEIENRSGFILVYSEKSVDLERRINIKARNETVSSILEEVFAGTDNYYEIYDRQIVILSKERQSTENLSGLKSASAQQARIITGKVTDSHGAPIPGVNIILKDTRRGVVSDSEGNYQIKAGYAEKEYLVFSFIGMKQEEVLIGLQERIDIAMQPEEQLVDDVVILGAYGTAQTRSDMVGSAFQISSKQIENLPANRVDLLLDGLVPGVKIDPNTDSPDNTRSRYNIRIRGEASLDASNEPLWIVDGTPVYTGDRTNQIPGMSAAISPLSFFNPEDIESITVLKDASATSIYGANGANGVILITTKKGRAGKTTFQVSTRYGISRINESTRFKVLNAKQYMELAREAYINAGLDMAYFPFQDNEMNRYSTTSTDWYDVFYGIGSNTDTDFSLSGGNERSSFYVSGSYFKGNQTVKGNTQERYSVRANTDLKLNERLTTSFNLFASYNINTLFNPGHDYYEFLPIYSPYNPDGTFRLYNAYVDGRDLNGNPNWKTSKFYNSVAEREENDNRQRAYTSNSNVQLNYAIANGIRFTTQIGADYQSDFEDTYGARTNWSGMATDGTPQGIATRAHVNFLTWTNIDRLNFDREFGNHSVSGVAGFEIMSKEYHTVSASGSGFVNDHIREVSYAVSQDGSSSAKTDHSMSYFIQGSYSYDKRHYLTLNVRRDGNSSFGKDVRWANFGSVAYSWNIHHEDFFKSKTINILKLKASFGSNGNSRLGSQEAQGAYSYSDSDNYIDEAGGSMSASPNPGLSWETTYMTNIGLRIKLFDRLDIDAEWYNNKTVDLLSNIDVSRTTGDTRVYRNIGSICNRGIEATITSDNIVNERFQWRTTLNLSRNKNKLLELYNGISKAMGNQIWREGYDLNTYYLIRWAGVDPRDGMPMWYDKNGNITRTFSYDDRVPGKTSTPDLTGGMLNTFTYGDLELRVLLNYTIGGYAFTTSNRRTSSDGLNIMSENQSVNQLDRWQKPGDQALSPKLLWGISTSSTMNSTRYLYNKTNVRLQNISLSYRVPKKMTDKVSITSCRLNLIADNPGLWTLYGKKNRNSYRQSMSGYPMESLWSVGIDVMF